MQKSVKAADAPEADAREAGYQKFREYLARVEERRPSNPRYLLGFRAGTPVRLEEVEPAEAIMRRFISSAMSLGALSPEAHATLSIGMNLIGARSNSGEGGEDPFNYTPLPNGDRVDNRIKQVASTPKTWLYHFDHVYPSAAERGLGAFHSSDVPFVFGNVGPGAIAPKNFPAVPSRAEDVEMSNIEMDYWVAFAKSGEPKASGRPDWAPFTEAGKSYMAFRDGRAEIATHVLPGTYELHDAYLKRLRAAEAAPWTNANIGIGSPIAGEQ